MNANTGQERCHVSIEAYISKYLLGRPRQFNISCVGEGAMVGLSTLCFFSCLLFYSAILHIVTYYSDTNT